MSSRQINGWVLKSIVVLILVTSIVVFIWGYWYTDTHTGITMKKGTMFPYPTTDPIYKIAGILMFIGAFGFFSGIALLIGLPKGKKKSSALNFCPHCGNKLTSDAIFCDQCGGKIES